MQVAFEKRQDPAVQPASSCCIVGVWPIHRPLQLAPGSPNVIPSCIPCLAVYISEPERHLTLVVVELLALYQTVFVVDNTGLCRTHSANGCHLRLRTASALGAPRVRTRAPWVTSHTSLAP